MAPVIEQTRAAPKEMPPLGWRINWWGILGMLCMVFSAVLSVKILLEMLEVLQAVGMLDVLPLLG